MRLLRRLRCLWRIPAAVAVKKVKRKVQVAAGPAPETFVSYGDVAAENAEPVATEPLAPQQFVIYVGWQYNCQCGNGVVVVVVIWMRSDMCAGGTSGCSDYNPDYNPYGSSDNWGD